MFEKRQGIKSVEGGRNFVSFIYYSRDPQVDTELVI
jgi:hypothetical protein